MYIEGHVRFPQWLDYEAELAVVIGKKERDIAIEDAMDNAHGFAIADDRPAIGWQFRSNTWGAWRTV